MKYFLSIFIILAISCSGIKHRGSKGTDNSKETSKTRKNSKNEKEPIIIKLSEESVLIDSLGFEPSYVSTLTKRQKKYLLEEYGFDDSKMTQVIVNDENEQFNDEIKDVYYRERYKEKIVENKKYELYGSELDGGMDKYFDIAMKFYDEGNLEKAKNILSFMKESLIENEQLWFESTYYLAECFIAENEFNHSLNLLLEILTKSNVPGFVDERAIVRTGQIYCILGNEEKAIKYFLDLRKYYPNSIYIDVADCSKI